MAVEAAAEPQDAAVEPQDAADGAIVIWDRAGLEAIALDPSGSYVLDADIDMGTEPWIPILFAGHLDGAGHSILNLTVRECDPTTAISVDGNAKRYDTVFAALFSRTFNATIENLTLLGVDVDVTVQQNAFAAGLVGFAMDTQIINCTVMGRVKLEMTERMCGVAGIVGFGYGNASECTVDVTLTLVDANHEIKCEEFMGGVLATGYLDVSGSDVRVRAYTSVYGYVHNGGIAGMYFVHTDDKNHKGYVRDNTVDAEIYFFEANKDRRAYCDPYVGERLNWNLQINGNTTANFVNGETRDYSKTLSPEQCDVPEYTETVTAPDCTNFGYTTYECKGCSYAYRAAYTLPRHLPGDWEVLREPTTDAMGLRQRLCTVCGVVLEEEAFALPPPDEVKEAPPAGSTGTAPGKAPEKETFPMSIVQRGAIAVLVFALIARLLVRKRRGQQQNEQDNDRG